MVGVQDGYSAAQRAEAAVRWLDRSSRGLQSSAEQRRHRPAAHRPAPVATKRKSGGATPTNKALYARVKAEAKRKFDVWPSAYASGWLTKEYKRRGGKYA